MENISIRKIIFVGVVSFLILFLFRLLYGYIYPYGYAGHIQSSGTQSIQNDYSKLNIASKRVKYESPEGSVRSVDQKYEKIASIESRSTQIDKDEEKIRNMVKKSRSIIQYEKTSGLKNRNNRVLRITIGVPPNEFDGMVSEIKKIGNIVSLVIDKRDKTNEYKDLMAKKESFLKIRASLIQLKNKGGKIDEYINLENRILEIEEKIQKLGISLGEFDSENEFCTIKLLLRETSKPRTISFLYRVKVALEWSVKYYFLFSFGFLFFSGGVWVLIKIYFIGKKLWMQKN